MINYVDIRNCNNNYWLKIPRPKEYYETSLNSAIKTVKFIIENYPAPYTLCLSGGLDSQAMLYAWMLSGVKFETFSAKYNNDFNKHDLDTLEIFANKNQLQINYYNLDVIDFLINEYHDYSLKYRCGSPHICVFMKFVDIINQGTVIFSGQMRKNSFDDFWSVDKNNFGMYRYAKLSGKHVVPWFFLETFDIYNNVIHSTLDKKKIYGDKKEIYDMKYKMYEENGYQVYPQEDKQTGFEKIKDFFDNNYTNLIQPKDKLIRHVKQSSRRNFDVLFRNKYEVKFINDLYRIEFHDK